jgi:hypothetical protein
VSELDEVARELHRVVDRLNSMPLSQAESCRETAHVTAAFIVERTRIVADHIPATAELPRVGVSAAGAQLAVVGNDYLAVARDAPGLDARPVLDALVTLRRNLP